ncbi:MAG: hypothetical protein M3082_18090 [Candidatus Dormibacteraeota bacterium]|nr:hypothetical protein [Candidatus Dormibacteraeota bacterium]
MRALSQDVVRLRRLWDDHTHRPFPTNDDDSRVQEVALYASWLGSMVEVALRNGTLNAEHAQMLKVRRAEGNQVLFRASADLGEPVRSYVARLITIEDILSGLPVK